MMRQLGVQSPGPRAECCQWGWSIGRGWGWWGLLAVLPPGHLWQWRREPCCDTRFFSILSLLFLFFSFCPLFSLFSPFSAFPCLLESPVGLVGLVTRSCPTFVTPWTVACHAPLSIGSSGQEPWSGLPFPSPDSPVAGWLFPISPAPLARISCWEAILSDLPAGLSTNDSTTVWRWAECTMDLIGEKSSRAVIVYRCGF